MCLIRFGNTVTFRRESGALTVTVSLQSAQKV